VGLEARAERQPAEALRIPKQARRAISSQFLAGAIGMTGNRAVIAKAAVAPSGPMREADSPADCDARKTALKR